MRKNEFMRIVFAAAILLISKLTLSQEIIKVTECNLNGWVKQTPVNTFMSFKNEPESSILGKGSVEMLTTEPLRIIRLRNTSYNGVPLSSITELSWSSFIETRDNDYDAPFVVLTVDLNGDATTDDFLEFGPQYQGQWAEGIALNQGDVVPATWQTWDMLHGAFWLGPTTDPEHGGALFTLATYISQHPTAKIVNDPATGGGGVRLSAGGGFYSDPNNPAFSFKCYVDNFRIGVNGATKIFDFEFSTADAGPDKTVVYGYKSNCVTLNGSAAGGVAPYTFLWSGGSTIENAVTEVCPTTTTTYTLSVTDARGCVRLDDVTVFVNDVRCGSKMDKVKLCHDGQQICVAQEAVEAHLRHGDILGECPESPILTQRKVLESIPSIEQNQLKLSCYPNPVTSTGKLEFTLPSDAKVVIKLFDVSGKELSTILQADKKAGRHQIEFSKGNLSGGIYYLLVTLSNGIYLSKTEKLFISSNP